VAGIQEVGKGQIEAAKALGWSNWQSIFAPYHSLAAHNIKQPMRKILPPLGNDLVAMIKRSALVP